MYILEHFNEFDGKNPSPFRTLSRLLYLGCSNHAVIQIDSILQPNLKYRLLSFIIQLAHIKKTRAEHIHNVYGLTRANLWTTACDFA